MISIVLPAYNEAPCIGQLLDNFDTAISSGNKECRLIVVNDGSTDNTAEIVNSYKNRLNIELISHQHNQGLAEALKTGLHHAVNSATDNDIIVTMDADNTHPPALLFCMSSLIREGNDIVIASRYVKGAKIHGVSLYRQMLSLGAALLFRICFPVHGVRDYTCGYRAYKTAILKKAFTEYGSHFISEKGFSCMVDILIKLSIFHPAIKEVPLVLRYDLKLSESKMNVGKTVRETIWLMVKRRWANGRGRSF